MIKKNGLGALAAATVLALASALSVPAAAQGIQSQPQEGAPQQGGPDPDDLEVEEFQDWTVRCLKDSNPRQCEMVQEIIDPESGDPVMMMVVSQQAQSDSLLGLLLLPLGILLPPGVGISIDGAEPQRLQVRHCEPGRCLVPWELSGDELAALRGGQTLEVIAYDMNEEEVTVPVSLLGFTAGLEQLSQ